MASLAPTSGGGGSSAGAGAARTVATESAAAPSGVTKNMTSSKFAAGLPLSVLGQNPGQFTLTGTNTYLVGTGSSRILIDTGEGADAYLPLLKATLDEAEASIQQILITHHHYDHVGGIQGIRSEFGADITVHKFPDGDGEDSSDAGGAGAEAIADGDVFKCEGATLRAIHTPGHTQDHVAFVLEEEGSVFTGDCVLGCGSTVFTDLAVYMKSLESLLALSPKTVYPGHGPVVRDGVSKISEYIDHRNAREKQVVSALESKPAGASPMQLVATIYAKDNLPPTLQVAAARSVALHCGKLLSEGRVTIGGSETKVGVDTVVKLKGVVEPVVAKM